MMMRDERHRVVAASLMLRRWVAASLGRWVVGSLGRWVVGPLGRWVVVLFCAASFLCGIGAFTCCAVVL